VSFTVTVLGSSSALPTSERNFSAHVLNVDERFFLIDCGEATQIQLRRFKIKFGRINHIFITHLHGDHILGLPGLVSSYGLLGRKNDLHIYAFAELENMMNDFSKFLGANLPFSIIFHHLDPHSTQLIYQNSKMEVYSFPLMHSSPTCGFLFKEKEKERNIKKEVVDKHQLSVKDILDIKAGADLINNAGKTIPNKDLTISPHKPRSYAYCSDTLYHEAVVPVIKNVDLLYHEATFSESNSKYAQETMHATAKQAAQIALKAKAKKLIIGHFSARQKNVSVLLNEARQLFPETYLANDGVVFNVDQVRGT
jgi:ribonuclease Z